MSAQAVPVTQLYKRLEVVGKGAYGSVHRGVHIASGQVVAIKIINLDTADDDVEDIQREVALLSQLRGGDQNNITRYYGCWLDGPRVWIVMDFASGGSVRTLMKACPAGIVEERFVVLIMRECLVALAYLHKAAVIHRDIKAANILVTSSGRVLLCDFGVAALLATTQSKRTTFVGTPYWMAPEVITTGSLYDTKADIWSLGITVYEMAMGAPPHADQVGMKALVIIPKAKPPRLPEERGSKEMREFVAACLRELPSDRLTAEELAKTKWIKSSSRVSVGVLRDLLNRYNRWQEGGGVRESIVGDLEWEMEEEAAVNRQSMGWEFETVRASNNSRNNSDDSATAVDMTEKVPSNAPTTSAPRSLRMLFEQQQTSSSPEPFRVPLPRSQLTTPTPQFLPPSGKTTPVGMRQNSNDADQSDSYDSSVDRDYELATARQPHFPARSLAPRDASFLRAKTPSRGPADESADESQGADASTSRPVARSVRSYKDIRTTRGLTDIAIPPKPSEGLAAPKSGTDAESSSPETSPGFPPGRTAPSPVPPLQARRTGASPANFQFPPPRSTAPSPAPSDPNSLSVSTSTSRGGGGLIDSRRPSPSRGQTLPVLPEMSPAVDKKGQDFLDAAGARPAGSVTPTLGAGAASTPRPTPSRQPSTSNLDAAPPIKPFARQTRSGSATSQSSLEASMGGGLRAPSRNARSGSTSTMATSVDALSSHGGAAGSSVGVGGNIGLGVTVATPRDMSKLSPTPTPAPDQTLMPPVAPGLSPSDLLPPSPSILSPMGRYFGGSSPQTANAPSSAFLETPQVGGPPSPMPSSGDGTKSFAALLPLPTPALRPLALAPLLQNPEETHAELARTVAELGKWLAVIDTGLTALLGTGSMDTGIIEEGTEDSEETAVLNPAPVHAV